MTAAVLRAHAARLPLPDGSVDLIVTSPPYFGLRSYTDGGEHYPGQIGSEGTPGEWLEALQACTREWVRVLKPEGSLFVNLGDKYSTGNSGDRNTDLNERWGNASGKRAQERSQLRTNPVKGIPPKSLLGLPWRYALGCTDRLGLILRAEIVWAKPNGLPESVTDRVRRAHEQVFHFTRQPRYYAAVDEIREPHLNGGIGPTWTERKLMGQAMRHGDTGGGASLGASGPKAGNPLGKLPGSVWPIPSQPLHVPASLGVDHFAAFPMELPRRLVLGWSPPGVCTECCQGRRPVAPVVAVGGPVARAHRHLPGYRDPAGIGHREPQRVITGYACGCPEPTAPTRPAIVLDPFGGTGTTALVASVHGRHGISVDLSADYCRLAAWRTTDPGERARALQVPKPPPPPEGMDTLFDLTEAQ